MGTLKWNNVTGSSTNAGSAALKNAGSLFSKAFDNFSGAVEDRQKRTTKSNTDAILNELRGISSQEDFDAREGGFDLAELSRRAGGEIDTTAISKALAGKRPELRAEETRVRNDLIGQIPNQILDTNAPGREGSLDYKGIIAKITQDVSNAGGSAGDIQKAVAAGKARLDERTSLSPAQQSAVAANEQELDILSTAALDQAAQQRDQVLAANPISHTLNAEGNAIAISDVQAKIRAEYPQGSVFGGIGGDELSEIVGEYSLNGITKNGSVGIKVGDKFKEGTVKVEPWMYTMAMDIAGQTRQDAYGSPTITNNLFRETLAKLAFDPQYKVRASNAAKAKRDFAKRSTELQLSRLKQGTQFTKDIKSSTSIKLLEQLQREAK